MSIYRAMQPVSAGQVKHIKETQKQTAKSGKAKKQALIDAYLQKQKSQAAKRTTPAKAAQMHDVERALKTQLKAKRQENRRLTKRIQQLEERLAQRSTEKTALKQTVHRVMKTAEEQTQTVRCQKEEIGQLRAEIGDLQRQQQAQRRSLAIFPQVIAFNAGLIQRQRDLIKQNQWVLHEYRDEKHDWEAKHRIYKQYTAVQKSLDKRLHTAHLDHQTILALRAEVGNLKFELKTARADIAKVKAARYTTGDMNPQALRYWVERLIRAGQLLKLDWLPRFTEQYRIAQIQTILADQSKALFGYFVLVNQHYAFKTLEGGVTTNYRYEFGRPRTDVVYQAVRIGDQIHISKVYQDVDPQVLQTVQTAQRHQRHQPEHFASWLPADAETVLAQKKVMLVTWHDTRILSRALRYFGAQPVIVNNHEKAIPWIKARAESRKIDFSVLMSEGLSHAVLETFGKQVIKERADIALVYHQRPEEIVRLCYDYFKNNA